MEILVANNQLQKIGGTESYTYALIAELIKRGHNVEYFTFKKGEISDRIENLGVNFSSKRSYDLIIANHNTCVDKLFNKGYIVQTCHGIYPKLEQPSPNADLFVSISEEVKNHLNEKGYRSTLIHNGVDCERFKVFKKINKTLKVVLSLCHEEETNNFIKECCDELNIEFIKINKYNDNVWDIERKINQADLVVGVGRSLYDSMACGRAVISYDVRTYMEEGKGDGYLDENNISEALKFNCSGRRFNIKFEKESFKNELKKYNHEDATFLRDFALRNLNIVVSTDKYLKLKHLYILKSVRYYKLIKRIKNKLLKRFF